MRGFSPWLSGLLDHGTPGTTKSVRFLESMEDPGLPSESGPDWQRSGDQWICNILKCTYRIHVY
ncbi:hypothetical protein OUZ56_025978 [Daphnia magna]|uniref:Uncharacterized protein n=1 Tax=Daphnia magna TaxID=35525 RepID=A0ABQ9ZKH7_9CRUS|nr:hypothetical protein OUZ56_025978 [Daphnia magna]